MRSATSNRYLALQQNLPAESQCAISNKVWTLAEISANQAKNLSLSVDCLPPKVDPDCIYQGVVPSYTYKWPIIGFAVKGASAVSFSGVTPSCDTDDNAGTATNPTLVDLSCDAYGGICVSTNSTGCNPEDWNLKFSVQWEKSVDNGITWFRLPDTSLNLFGNKIAIGVANSTSSPLGVFGYNYFGKRVIDGDTTIEPADPQYWSTANTTEKYTQFYGVIDSVRISRGTARYTNTVCAPYNPHAPAEELIDEHVLFALNIGTNEYQVTGGRVFPYYTKSRGWLYPKQPVYETNYTNALGVEIRNVYDSSTAISDFSNKHGFLTYSTREAGYKGRRGISFPSTLLAYDFQPTPVLFAQGLIFEDQFLPPPQNAAQEVREIFVDAATTVNLATDFSGRIFGNKRNVDTLETALNKKILVKDQDNPEENGVYVVAVDASSSPPTYPWRRLTYPIGHPQYGEVDTYENARIFVLGPDDGKNYATVWYADNPSASFVPGETPVSFVQEQPCGLYKEDFCVEAYFKVAGFLHPNGRLSSSTSGAPAGCNMTLIDTYYGSPVDTDERYSGVRIYFQSIDGAVTGKVVVDIGPYSSNPEEVVPDYPLENKGPALQSQEIQAGVFYHVALTRSKDVFRLYLNGVLQGSFIAQETQYIQYKRNKEDNYILYRARAFFGEGTSKTSGIARFNVKPSEIFFNSSSTASSVLVNTGRFNGAAGVLTGVGVGNTFLNPPGFAKYNPSLDLFYTYPGFPQPDTPADTHVYILNNLAGQSVSNETGFVFIPNIRFPNETTLVDVASVPTNTTYVAYNGLEKYIANAGNVVRYGISKNGARATGTLKLVFNSAATFPLTFHKNTVFTVNGVTFLPAPKNNLYENEKTLFTLTKSTATITDNYVIKVNTDNVSFNVPVVAEYNGASGNLAPNTVLTLGTKYGTALAASVANVSSLYGLQTIDGVSLQSGNYVLLKDQTNAAENGIYVIPPETDPDGNTLDPGETGSVKSWVRAAYLNTTESVTNGAGVKIQAGTVNANKTFFIRYTNFTAINVSPMPWEETFNGLTSIAAVNTFLGGVDDDPTVTKTIDGIPLAPGMRVLLKDQTDRSTNGIYVIPPKTDEQGNPEPINGIVRDWIRAPELDTSAELKKPLRVFVKNGYKNSNKGYEKSFTGNEVDVIPQRVILNETGFTFRLDSAAAPVGTKIVSGVQDGFCGGPGVEIINDDVVSYKKSLEVSEEPIVLVDCVTTAPIALNGIQTNSADFDNAPQTAFANTKIILVRAQADKKQNGVYTVNTGDWTRVPHLSRSEHFVNNLLVAPTNGDSCGTGVQLTPYPSKAYRLQIPENFVLDESDVETTETVETLQKIHLPFNWRFKQIETLRPDNETGIQSVSAGNAITFTDTLQPEIGEDLHVWRVRFKCGNTIAYSRNIIIRAATGMDITTEDIQQWTV